MNTQTTQSHYYTSELFDLDIDILRMISKNTKYIRNKKRLNRKLKTAFTEVLHETLWDRPIRQKNTYHIVSYHFTIHKCLFDRFSPSYNRQSVLYNLIGEIEDELEETD